MNSDYRGIDGNDAGVPLGDPAQGVRYEVFVGHTRVHVKGQDVGDAIHRARQLLCRDMPRLWDVIQALRADQFQVRPLPEPGSP